MCHGHPHHHPCSHQSVTWHYCPAAQIDLDTGYETPCSNVTFATSQPTSVDCPLQNCEFKASGGSWTCCVCHQGPNTQGWCSFKDPKWVKNHLTDLWEMAETCDHGCCENCTQYDGPAGQSTVASSSGISKKGGSRKDSVARRHPSRKGTGLSTCEAAEVEDERCREPGEQSGSPESSSTRRDVPKYDVNLDYGAGKGKQARRNDGRKSRES